MAIYRGTGGAGDADNDATITEVTQQANNAAASASAAATSASNASTSESNASTSASTATSQASAASSSATAAGVSASSAAASAATAASYTPSQTGNAGKYLTTDGSVTSWGTVSVTETNDLTSAVTWANVPDANITESSVTQHQAALSITESQVSDLGSYITGNQTITLSGDASGSGTTAITVTVADDSHNHIISNVDGLQTALDAKLSSVPAEYLTQTEGDARYLQSFTETNDLTAAVTWANVPDANITESSVTQHQTALSITESQISDLDKYTDADVDTHLNTSTATSSQVLSWNGSDYDWVDPVTGSGGIANIVEDTTPQLGGTLDANSNTIDMGANIISDTKVGQWDTAYGWGDHSTQGYLTSFTETNDLTAAVTWANVPNANITQGSVTQHQAALSITESQISDLDKYTDADVNTHLNTSTAATNEVLSWNGSDYDWVTATAGATGGGSDQVFYENDQTVTTNYTITTNKNAMTAGPITVDSGITVTVPSGSTWTIV